MKKGGRSAAGAELKTEKSITSKTRATASKQKQQERAVRGAWAKSAYCVIFKTKVIARRDDMPPPIAADLRPCADGSAVRTALVGSCGAAGLGAQPRHCLMPPPYGGGHNNRNDVRIRYSIVTKSSEVCDVVLDKRSSV